MGHIWKFPYVLLILYWMLDFACLIQNSTWLKKMQIIFSSVWTLGFIQFIILWELSCLYSWSHALCRYRSVNSQTPGSIGFFSWFLELFLLYSYLTMLFCSANFSCLRLQLLSVFSFWKIVKLCLYSPFLYCGVKSTSS